jgi:hypothetical protein
LECATTLVKKKEKFRKEKEKKNFKKKKRKKKGKKKWCDQFQAIKSKPPIYKIDLSRFRNQVLGGMSNLLLPFFSFLAFIFFFSCPVSSVVVSGSSTLHTYTSILGPMKD